MSHRLLRPDIRPSKLQARWLAVSLLLSFMGATLGWALSWSHFVDRALLAYLSGFTAQEVFDTLALEEFGQVGSVFRIAQDVSIASDEANAEAFARCVRRLRPHRDRWYAQCPCRTDLTDCALTERRCLAAECISSPGAHCLSKWTGCRWLSTAYMTWALLGVPHPGAGAAPAGWAWVRLPERRSPGVPAAVSATRLAHEAVGLPTAQGDADTGAGMRSKSAGAGAHPDSAIVANAMAEFVGRSLTKLADAGDSEDAAAVSSSSDGDTEALRGRGAMQDEGMPSSRPGQRGMCSVVSRARTRTIARMRTPLLVAMTAATFGHHSYKVCVFQSDAGVCRWCVCVDLYRAANWAHGQSDRCHKCLRAHADVSDLAGKWEQARSQALHKRFSDGLILAKVSDPGLAQGSSAVTYMMQQLGLVRMARDAVSEAVGKES